METMPEVPFPTLTLQPVLQVGLLNVGCFTIFSFLIIARGNTCGDDA